MWPFKRKQSNQSAIPPEVQDYYQAERRERVGVAWLLALATLVTTILLAVGIFYGGRWTYRKITKQNKPVATTKKTNPEPAPEPQNKPSSVPVASSPGSGSTISGGTVAAPTNPISVPKPSQSPSTPAKTTLVNTGPGDTVAIFVGTTITAAIGHNLYTKRKLSVKN